MDKLSKAGRLREVMEVTMDRRPYVLHSSLPLHTLLSNKDSFRLVRLLEQKLPLELLEVAFERMRRGEAEKALHGRWRLTPSTSPSSPLSTATLLRSTLPPSLLSIRLFSSSSRLLPRGPFRPPLSYYDHSMRFTHPSSLAAHRPGPKTPPPPPASVLIPLTVFADLPSDLRPSYRTILRLIGWDRLALGLTAGQNQDMANAQNSTYVDLRNQAIHEGDLMVRLSVPLLSFSAVPRV